jgi:subtilisin family serine protease
MHMRRSIFFTLALGACTSAPEDQVQNEGFISAESNRRADLQMVRFGESRVSGIADQIALAKNGGLGISLDPNSTEPVRVWVQYDPARRGEVMEVVAAANGLVHHTFDDLEAFAVTLPGVVIDALQELPGVVFVELDQPRFPLAQSVPYGIDAVQAPQAWSAGATGSGVTVCVIDSGLYTGHEDHQGSNVIGGYPSGWNTDLCGHGTHVTGSLNAQNNSLGVVGVSPGDVSLYIVKVFGDDCVWSYSSDLADAANRCAAAGARIISMSLGGGRSNAEQRAFDNLYAQGILSIAAAGNDGNTTTSYPAGYASVVSVAAVDSNNVVADFSQRNADVELAAPGVAVLSTVPYLDDTSVTVSGTRYAGTHMDGSARGSASGTLVDGGLCDSVGSWGGNVVLCERGVISFYDKVNNVRLGGGVAAVIYNNTSGDLLGTLEPNTSTIIGIGITQADGQFLAANRLGQTANVTSVFTAPASSYQAWDGTSMATPHVSGAAALVWSADLSLTNVEVRNALVSTALDLGAAGRDNSYGFGLVQAADAVAFVGGSGCSSNADCADGNLCNGSETCSGGSCNPGTPVSCAPGETCDPATGTCSGGTCAPRGDSCSSNADCCSNRCRFRRGAGSCR